jgi:hypothetical protein
MIVTVCIDVTQGTKSQTEGGLYGLVLLSMEYGKIKVDIVPN